MFERIHGIVGRAYDGDVRPLDESARREPFLFQPPVALLVYALRRRAAEPFGHTEIARRACEVRSYLVYHTFRFFARKKPPILRGFFLFSYDFNRQNGQTYKENLDGLQR